MWINALFTALWHPKESECVSLYGSNRQTADTRSKVKVKCVTEQLRRLPLKTTLETYAQILKIHEHKQQWLRSLLHPTLIHTYASFFLILPPCHLSLSVYVELRDRHRVGQLHFRVEWSVSVTEAANPPHHTQPLCQRNKYLTELLFFRVWRQTWTLT